MHRPSHKWTAFFLSLIAPGAGQLFVGSLWCVPWFTLGGCLYGTWAISSHFVSSAANWIVVQSICGVLLGLCSGEQAKRICERSAGAERRRIRSHSLRHLVRGRSVQLSLEIDSSYSCQQLWSKVADLQLFLTIDPFHQRITLMRPVPGAGVDLVLSHNVFGIRFLRFGRILRWQPESGYAFSDLSRHGKHQVFPHVFFVSCAPVLAADSPTGVDPQRSRLAIDVRGKWSSRVIPVWLGVLWLRWVNYEHARLLRKGL